MNLLLSIAQLAKSTYYYWVKKLDKPDKYSKIKQEITAIVKESRNSYGYRRVTLALKMKGYTINHKTVRKLMSQMGLTCQIRIKRYKSYKGTVGKIAKNVLKRNFSVDTPNKKWVTDVTEFKIKGRKIYLSPILDLFNGEIISYIKDELKSIFKASELELTRERKEHFLEKYGCDSKLSAACDILENGFEDAIQILSFPENIRRRIRTTNVLERLNEEIRRRERVIRIFPNINSITRIIGTLFDGKRH
ncbi:hypothetical protein EfmJHP80_18700 [Enterococcus faecium]|nr:hypothetical protein EfmJHP80_18700 [Enterococcus faecium]